MRLSAVLFGVIAVSANIQTLEMLARKALHFSIQSRGAILD
jgi:hypothetical protein